ncbi:hypothetical protein EL26_15475 [Tumebacillus flagellatus]|uniref:Thiamine pyrophosphate enzyme N-terminal TPP-binding domain-containing protein n=1 Tax=Tumebacillus flagellatus TaxID=1157490 RepID=A0A074M946_9BACL|nr:hypothetical protein EL26_15475 [Tumebacillus flagellatus]
MKQDLSARHEPQVSSTPTTSPEHMTGSRMVVECFKRLGIDTVFGYPGGAILPLNDARYDSGVEHVMTRHEQAAIHAAEGYARATG